MAAGRALSLAMLMVMTGACGTAEVESDSMSAEATIFRIDRICPYRFTVSEPGAPVRTESGVKDCQVNGDFLRSVNKPGMMRVNGSAAVKVTYTAPQDGSAQVGELVFGGQDDEFYALKAGDKIRILVANKDLTSIRLD